MNFEPKSIHQPSSGKLLIAEPFMGDNNFDRTVILLCEHNERGSFGFVINHQTDLVLADVMDDSYSEQPLFLGGPVENNTLHFLHRLGPEVASSVDLGNGIYWAGDFQYIKQKLNYNQLNSNDIRLFVGYSGWDGGQLNREMARNSWYISDADAGLIFDTDTKDLWRETLRRMGGNYKVIANYPSDPRLN